jgi:hypothetical protein
VSSPPASLPDRAGTGRDPALGQPTGGVEYEYNDMIRLYFIGPNPPTS